MTMSQPPAETTRSSHRRIARAGRWGLVVAVLVVSLAGVVYWRASQPLPAPPVDAISRLDRAEETILALTPELKKIAHDLLNLELPGIESRHLFASKLGFVDVAADEPVVTDTPQSTYNIRQREWSLAEKQAEVRGDQLAFWQPLVSESEYFERAKFYFVEADIDLQDEFLMHAKMGFDGLAVLADGHRAWVRAKMHVEWRDFARSEEKEKANWRIVDWQTDQLVSTESADPLFFRDVTLTALDPEVAQGVRQSPLDQLLIRVVRDQDYTKTDDQEYMVSLQQWSPAVSIVDLDQDGYDDFFVAKNWGKSSFFHNRGDGTFEDWSAKVGLDLENFCTCALFADFDNDGDADALIGRTLRPSLYLENVDGRFVDRMAEKGQPALPSLVFSMSAADFNSDGLLDVYFCTYANRVVQQAISNVDPEPSRRLLARLLGQPALDEMLQQAKTRHPVLDRIGPRNQLFSNRGEGRFELADESQQVAIDRNTYQATWCDFDQDGDPDLYSCNDYAPNNLFRNDGPAGFTDITESSHTADIGFGMGASWGDYDNDGQFDVYVSNMFSKAGRRITARVPGINPLFALMARGNTLFHNLGNEKFEKVSGLEPPALMVESAGWAWSGQFVDLDNDGFQDICAASGNLTFPDEVAFDVDL